LTVLSRNRVRFRRGYQRLDKKNIKLLWLALLVGILAGLTSSLFRWLLIKLEQLRVSYVTNIHGEALLWLWLFIITFIAIYLALFLSKRWAPEISGSGIQEVEGALDGFWKLRWKVVIPLKFISSIFSLGSGMLLGREGPTIQMGAHVGQMVKDWFEESDEKNNALISTGASAGLAGAFNAPLSGVIFVMEEMNEHFKFNFFSVAAIMIGAGTADSVVRLLLGNKPVIMMHVFSFENLNWIWLFAVLGVLLSFVGYFFNHFVIKSLDLFKKFKFHFVGIAVLLGATITAFSFYSMDFVGAGYETIYKILTHSFTLKMMAYLLLVRFILTLVSYGSGVPGGIFAPLLTLGVISGMVFGVAAKMIFPEAVDDPAIFAVAGMAGIFAATVRAPITGVVLAIELTSNFALILPLILTALVASVLTTLIGNKPIYTELLKRVLQQKKDEKIISDAKAKEDEMFLNVEI
jgi:CIC family chloride channel protein